MVLAKEVVLEKMSKAHVVVLDVQPEADFEALHIRGSHPIPLGGDPGSFAQKVEMKFGRDKFFIVYGSSQPALNALDAAEDLRKKGLWAEAYPEGLEDWRGAGYPTEGTQAWKKADHP